MREKEKKRDREQERMRDIESEREREKIYIYIYIFKDFFCFFLSSSLTITRISTHAQELVLLPLLRLWERERLSDSL